MPVELTRDAIDLGIVVTDGARALAFYRDLLGFVHEGDIPMPIGHGTMHRLRCGESLIKLVAFDRVPEGRPAPGALTGGTGYRYFTMHVSNLSGIMADCEAAGVPVIAPITEIRPGVTIGMVEDPDGNAVEFVESS